MRRLARCLHLPIPFKKAFATGHPQVQPLNLVDVIAVLPFYLKLVMDTSQIGVFGALPHSLRVLAAPPLQILARYI